MSGASLCYIHGRSKYVTTVANIDISLARLYELGEENLEVYDKDNLRVYVCIGEDVVAKTRDEWFEWFEHYGNHTEDGWDDAESWFYDMLRIGMFI